MGKTHDDVIALSNIPPEQVYRKQFPSPFLLGWDWPASLLAVLEEVKKKE